MKEVAEAHRRTIKEELEKIQVPSTPSEQLKRLNSVMIEAQKTLPKKSTKPQRTWHTSEETARLLEVRKNSWEIMSEEERKQLWLSPTN